MTILPRRSWPLEHVGYLLGRPALFFEQARAGISKAVGEVRDHRELMHVSPRSSMMHGWSGRGTSPAGSGPRILQLAMY